MFHMPGAFYVSDAMCFHKDDSSQECTREMPGYLPTGSHTSKRQLPAENIMAHLRIVLVQLQENPSKLRHVRSSLVDRCCAVSSVDIDSFF